MCIRATGSRQGTEDAPLTEAGKAKFDKNKPGYGPRAVPPAIGNDPMGTCDPLGIPRLSEYGSHLAAPDDGDRSGARTDDSVLRMAP